MNLIKIATHPDHLAHPFTRDVPLPRLTLGERIKGCVLFAFACLGTLGILGGIYIGSAFWKNLKIQIKSPVNPKPQEPTSQLKPKPQEPLKPKPQEPTSQKKLTLDETMDQIKALAGKKKLCLFVGRAANEPTPKTTDQEEWISLDLTGLADGYISNGQKFPREPYNRLHLQMSFNDTEQMRRIQGLFDQVVLDFSTLKFFDKNPWKTLSGLLNESQEATLITEAESGLVDIIGDPSQDRTLDGRIAVPMNEILSASMNDKDEEVIADYTKKGVERIEQFLSTLFEKVERKKGPYPYNYRGTEFITSYFILKCPKKN
jgi:hypothetical protein